jgi:NAD(P)H-dependent flavin oxidoreductase YrpB (nitropropane dioxygenase family)
MKVPGYLDDLSESNDIIQPIDTVEHDDDVFLKFSPNEFWEAAGRPDLAIPRPRPKFLPIVSSVVLAQSLLKRATGKGPTKGVDGFVIELNTAGGHNAPPRGFKYDAVTKTHSSDLNERGEPIYGEKDEVDLEKFAKAAQGLPFWLAGSYADPKRLVEVLEAGGAGVQVGTAFALAKESGMNEHSRQTILSKLAEGKDVDIFTDPEASPTGFPFKVLDLEDTLSDPEEYENRPRACTLGYLRDIYKKPDGKLGYRCSSEPVADYVKKGGQEAATQGRKCLCNALCADAGFPQVQRKPFEYVEQPLVTMGDDVKNCKRFLKADENGRWSYSARDVVNFLVRDIASPNVIANQGNITSMLST